MNRMNINNKYFMLNLENEKLNKLDVIFTENNIDKEGKRKR